MSSQSEASKAGPCTAGGLLYPVAALLVIAYVNTFELWALLVGSIGSEQAALVPFATLAAGLGLTAWWIILRRGTIGMRPVLLIMAVALALLGLTLTDPAYPAKRIHVPQYILLALVLRRALSDHVGGTALNAATMVVTLIFGIHDEMLQGLHPSRTYGLRDIVVNGTAGASGALAAVGVGLWRGPSGPLHLPAPIAAALAVQAVALTFLVMTLMRYVGVNPVDAPPPAWAGAPLAIGGIALMALFRSGSPSPGARHIHLVISWTTLPLALYPVIPHVTPLVFH
jgi:hypothetical protein